MIYAVRISEGRSVQVIVGSAEYARSHLGGDWIESLTNIGLGWEYDSVTDSFQPPNSDLE